jgi:hypothetical protein
MSIYLLVAIALGALSGVAEAPASRPVLASVALRSDARRREQRVVRAVAAVFAQRRAATAPGIASLLFARVDAPLSGAATPRAPAEK